MKRKLSFIIIIVLAISTSGYTQTTIPGGDVSGSWDISGSPYLIEGEITVLANDTLTIDPGVEINFQGHHKLIVNGWLLAEGAEEDSILFTAADTSEGWHGIRFVDAPDNSHLSYCIIEQGYAAGSWPDMTGGGILCQNSHPVLTHCTIRNNDAVFGGGVYCYQSVPEIAYCEFTDNTAIRTFSPRGGGLYLNTCDPIVRNCLFSGNVTLWQGGAIVCDYSTAVILNCTIVGNECGTTATSGGGGIYVADSNPTIKNTIVAGNYGRGGIRFVSSPFTSISYCDFFDNQYEDFWDNPIGNLGVMITVNANGDSCDAYYNVFEDPLFQNPPESNYSLSTNSPCIDAGDPVSPFDPDSTISDIGAFYYDQSLAIRLNPGANAVPSQLSINAHPNPFNPTTAISIQLSAGSEVNLSVYDISGRKVATLIDGFRNAGSHEVTFDGSQLASGIYLYRLTAGEFSAVGKMVLMK